MDDFYDSFDTEITPEMIKGEEIAPMDVIASEGNVKISSDVISTIAGIAAGEIPGVYGMYNSIPGVIAEKLGAKKSRSTGVKVDVTDNNVELDVYIVVKHGFKIRQIAESVQENVKNNVETMTGLDVIAVNVHVESIIFEKKSVEMAEIVDFLDE